MAISSPLLETSINGAKGVLVNVTGSMDIGLEEVETAANLVQEAAHPEANIIFGLKRLSPGRPPRAGGGGRQESRPPLWRSLPPAQEKAVVSDDGWDILGVFSAKSADLIPFYAQPPGGNFPAGRFLLDRSAFIRSACAA